MQTLNLAVLANGSGKTNPSIVGSVTKRNSGALESTLKTIPRRPACAPNLKIGDGRVLLSCEVAQPLLAVWVLQLYLHPAFASNLQRHTAKSGCATQIPLGGLVVGAIWPHYTGSSPP